MLLNEVSDERQLISGKNYSREDFLAVNRFENHGGGWGYSGHSVESIRFMADIDILLGGFGLFGGRGEYTAKLKLLDIGPEGGEQENDGEVLVETEEIPYECGPRQKFPILFDEPIQLQGNRWYVAWCRISGPSSDCGSSGQAMVTTEDQVTFYFKSSKTSNNGTDVNAGQIPQLLYKIVTPENLSPPRQMDFIEPIHILSKEFSRTVSKQCFQSLLSLLQWSWNTFKCGFCERQSVKNTYTNLELERLVYISKASLRIICTYTNEIYPKHISKKSSLENVQLAECIGDVRSLLKQILSDNIFLVMQGKRSNKMNASNNDMLNSVLDECHNTFVSCFHAFYPTSYLKWTCLCDLLSDVSKENNQSQPYNSERLLSAVLCALSAPSVRLRGTFPLIGNSFISESSLQKGLSPSDNNGLPMMNVSDSHYYPILVEQMSYKSQIESNTAASSWQWNDVLDLLLDLVSQPVVKSLYGNSETSLTNLSRYCCHLLARVLAELVHQCNATEDDIQGVCGRTMHVTPSRFTRTNQSRTWNTGNGSPDAICFQVDHPGTSIVGVGIYGGIGHYEYELEILEDISSSENHTHTHRWNSLEMTRGSFGPEDFAPEVIEIKFDRPVPIKENIKYALRLRNHGGRTNNGDGGLSNVKGSDGTVFTFSTCSLSFNGTTLTRGQIPVLLYYSQPAEYGRAASTKVEQQARSAALSMMSAITQKAANLMILAREKAEEVSSADILSKSFIVNTLLPLVLAHISPLATSDPRSAVYILSLIHQILPHVTALNLNDTQLHYTKVEKQIVNLSNADIVEHKITTTSHHYTLVESDHPYKPATVNNYRVTFPETVKWMSLEFDPACSTVQPEDSLQIYIPAIEYMSYLGYENVHFDEGESSPKPFWPVLNKFCGSLQWPTNSVLIPGNEVFFSLETASDYLKDERLTAFGFKCLIIGYEWPPEANSSSNSGLKHLEAELSFLGGMCSASLMKKEILLPSVGGEEGIDFDSAETIAAEIFSYHGGLLSKGIALSSVPSVQQALDGILPYSTHSNERLFLRDFVNCVEGSSGGRLAQWLQPGSRVDPTKCQILYSREEFICGWPAMITVLTRDQYGDVVFVPNMKIEVKAIPIDKKESNECDAGRKMRRLSEVDSYTFGGLPPPPLHHPYEPTIRDRMCFHSITVMKAYQNYSFEELRYTSPPVKRSGENMLVRGNCDGTYCATWTPAATGCFSIIVTIDGYDLEEMFKVDVKEPPQGMTPPNQNLAKKSSHQPSKLRKFVAKNSGGLRVRAHPSLQSEQIGIVHVNGTIAFIDEIHNDDGVWLRLSSETIKQYCNTCVIEAWCLQYNQHLGRTLLLPVEEPRSILDHLISDTIMRKLPEIQSWQFRNESANTTVNYQVIKCGASGHNVRVRPSLKAPPVGMLVLGNRIAVTEYTVNSDGCWVKLDRPTMEKYCFNTDSEAWSLAIDQDNVLFLGNSNDADSLPNVVGEGTALRKHKRGFNFSYKSEETNFTFSGSKATPPSGSLLSTNPFIFGESLVPGSPKLQKKDKKECKPANLPKWFIENVKAEENVNPSGSSSSIKSVMESGNNGNGITPPDTPRRCSSPRNGSLSQKPIKSSSPIPKYESVRRGSSQSDSSALLSEAAKGVPHPLNQLPQKEISPHGSAYSNSSTSPQLTPVLQKECSECSESPKKVIQTGTQTSPENSTLPVKNNFSIGSTAKEERVSPKLARKDRNLGKMRPKRSISPANLQQLPSTTSFQNTKVLKEAMSPSVAESLRAVFAAFLWHEGIVHDAMACASFLKFHPTLPKQGAIVVTRNQEVAADRRRQDLTKEERARQRHSVEVSNAGTYLHIQPSTLESLTRSAANANANRNRKKLSEGLIKEERKKVIDENFPYQTISVLPPALKSLVYLWEELASNCLQTFTSQIHNPAVNGRAKKNERSDMREKNIVVEKETRRCRKKKIPPRNYLEDLGSLSSYLQSSTETLCELCRGTFQHPVTYHMRQIHPGCGQHASGKGYNSGGNYCLGWAGNCGDGGIPGSSWYLLCEACRDKYLKSCHNEKQKNASSSHRSSSSSRYVVSKPVCSPAASTTLEPHIVMKQNAMFLLELSSSADMSIKQRRQSGGILPAVSENITPPDYNGPFGPPPPFQCFQSLGVSLSNDNFYANVLRNHDFRENYGYVPSSGQRPLSDISISDNDSDTSKGLRFYRSVSMGTNGLPWSKSGYDGRVIMLRRRNNSSCEFPTEGGSSLLCNPSPALQKLIKDNQSTTIGTNNTVDSDQCETLTFLHRPAMQFILQQHDLRSLKFAMRQALRKATCRVYAMQALNWLLKSVTQPICLHDLLWWFVTSLSPIEVETEGEDENAVLKKDDEQELNACEHPLSDISIAAEAMYPLPNTFHTLLQTIADLMILLPMGSALQQMAIKCWGIKFNSTDHSFLHRSQVFSNISKILSRSEEMEDFIASMKESHQSFNQVPTSVQSLRDITSSVEIKASSRQAMIASLTDNSTETFWESGDEDRNKTKNLTIFCSQGCSPLLICVHVDNCRDLGNKISSVAFYCGQNTDELIKLRTVEVETRLLGGWINCPITDSSNSVIRLELKGPDNSVRIRQIRVLGTAEGESLNAAKQCTATMLQQKNCEIETLRVFRLITSQVFGKLLQCEDGQNVNVDENVLTLTTENGDPSEESNDLREHMVGILFSRSKLTHLQKQVIVHIVQAIRKETERVHIEWESNLNSSEISSNSEEIINNSDTYCFEMLSMVLALSGSSVGRNYLSHQGGLLADIVTLLHTGSARVQRQVSSLLRRMLSEITPEEFGKVIGVRKLPAKDFSIVSVLNKDSVFGKSDVNEMGILDVFLSVIAKALTLQVKVRSKNGNVGPTKEITTFTLASAMQSRNIPAARWWLKGTVSKKLAEGIILLMKDMAAGKISEAWTSITKSAIAENILHLTYLSEDQRVPSLCLETSTFWLALASLCVLNEEHVERLSSGQWSQHEGQPLPPRPTCGNHDDGETVAVIQCSHCGNLCADCDRYLHLHRKTRNHQRQVCKEEEEAIKVELHEGCGRTKLFWLLALADPRTLKALAEFREGGARTKGVGISGVCRFCGTTGNSGLLAISNVCADHECQEYSRSACTKVQICGHMCGGILGESKCLPCLHGCSRDSTLRQDADDMCMICFTEALSSAPAIQLKCGHVFHMHCCKAALLKRWAGPRISFSFMLCPICKEEMKHEVLNEILAPILELYKDVHRKALMRLEYEGLHTVEAVVTPGARFYNDPAAYAMDRYAYYVCYKCKKAYYGGEARCDVEMAENYDPKELVCGACSDVARAQMCPKHGTDFLEYKCRYCCSVAVFFCFGTTHFCNACHDDFQKVTNLPKNELPSCPTGPKAKQLEGDECPLHIKHPPTGEEFSLGCGVCRNAHTF